MKQRQATRLRRLEQQAHLQQGGFELWVGTDEDAMLSPTGAIITLAEFNRRYPDGVDLCADADA